MTVIVDTIVKFVEKLIDWRPRFILRRQCRRIFSFAPSKKSRVRSLEQEAVDKKLKELNQHFVELCRQEDEIYSSTSPYREGVSPLTARGKVLDLRPELEAAENRFWEAWHVVKRLGFKVKPKRTDYLPEPSFDL